MNQSHSSYDNVHVQTRAMMAAVVKLSFILILSHISQHTCTYLRMVECSEMWINTEDNFTVQVQGSKSTTRTR